MADTSVAQGSGNPTVSAAPSTNGLPGDVGTARPGGEVPESGVEPSGYRPARGPSSGKRIDLTEEEKATVRIDIRSRVQLSGSCWRWSGNVRGDYGSLSTCGRYEAAHRLSYAAFNGTVPEGIGVLHSCDYPLCVNPSHLFLGDHTANMRDMWRKKRNSHSGQKNSRAIITLDDANKIRSMHVPRTCGEDRKFGSKKIAEATGIRLNIVEWVLYRGGWPNGS